MDPVKELVLKYFSAWQKQDHHEVRGFLGPSFEFDSGMQHFLDADEYSDFCRKLPPWSKITLLDSLFTENQAALLYEGVSQFGARFRIAEFIRVDEGKIAKISVVYSPLSQQQ